MRDVSSGRGNRQKVTDTGCNKFLRINEQVEAVKVRRPETWSRKKL